MEGNVAFAALEPRDMSRLKAELAASNERVDRAEALLRNAGEETSRMSYHVEQLQQELAQAKCDLAKSREEAAATASLATALGARTADLDHEVVALREKSYQLELESAGMAAEQDRLRAELAGAQSALDEAVAARHQLATQLEDACQQQARNTAAAAAAEERFRAEVQQLQVRLAASEAEGRAVQHARGTLLDDLQRARGDVLALQGQLKDELRQKELLAGECRRLQRELEAASEGLLQAQRAQRTTAAGAAELEEAVERLRSGRHGLETELQAASVRVQRLQEESRQLTERNTDLVNQLHGLSTTVRQLEAENARLSDGHATLTVEAEARAAEVRAARGEAAELAADRARLMAELQALRLGNEESEVGRLQSALTEARAEVSRLRKELASNDTVLGEAEAALVALVREKEGLEQQLNGARAAERLAVEAAEGLRAQVGELRAQLGAVQAQAASTSSAAAAVVAAAAAVAQPAVLEAQASGPPTAGLIDEHMIKYLQSLDIQDTQPAEPSDVPADTPSPPPSDPTALADPEPVPVSLPQAASVLAASAVAAAAAALASSSPAAGRYAAEERTSCSGSIHSACPPGGPNTDAWEGASAYGWDNSAGESFGGAAAATAEVLLFPAGGTDAGPGPVPHASGLATELFEVAAPSLEAPESITPLESESELPKGPSIDGDVETAGPADVAGVQQLALAEQAAAAAAAAAVTASVGPSTGEPTSPIMFREMERQCEGKGGDDAAVALGGDGAWPAGQRSSLTSTPVDGLQGPLQSALEALEALSAAAVVSNPTAAVGAKASEVSPTRSIRLRTSPSTSGPPPSGAALTPEQLSTSGAVPNHPSSSSPRRVEHEGDGVFPQLATASATPASATTTVEQCAGSPRVRSATPTTPAFSLASTPSVSAPHSRGGGELQERYSASPFIGACLLSPICQASSSAYPATAAAIASATSSGGVPVAGPYTDQHSDGPQFSVPGGMDLCASAFRRQTDTALLSAAHSRASAVAAFDGSSGPPPSSAYRLSPLLSNVMLRGPSVTPSGAPTAAASDAPSSSERAAGYQAGSPSHGGIGPAGSPMISPRVMLEARMLSRAVRPSAEALVNPFMPGSSAAAGLAMADAAGAGLASAQPQEGALRGEAASLAASKTIPLLQALASQQLTRHHGQQQAPLGTATSRPPAGAEFAHYQHYEPSAFSTPVASDIAATAASFDAAAAARREARSTAPTGPDVSAGLLQTSRRLTSEQVSGMTGWAPAGDSGGSGQSFRAAVSVPFGARQPSYPAVNAGAYPGVQSVGGSIGQPAWQQLYPPIRSGAMTDAFGILSEPPAQVAAAVTEPQASNYAQSAMTRLEERRGNETESLLAQRLAAMDEALRAIGAA